MKGSNFQEWPISFPVSGIAKDFALINNLTSSRTLERLNCDGSHKMSLMLAQFVSEVLFDHVHCFSGFTITKLFTKI